MILADKIIELRKKSGWTQEELAEKLEVSRQAVSKWESAQATPDLIRILKMSELFSVSTDVLLKDDLDLTDNSETDSKVNSFDETKPALKHVSMAEATEFLQKNEKNALLTGLGVVLCIMGPAVEFLFDAVSMDTVGTAIMLFLIAVAVGIFICSSSFMKKFDYIKEEFIDTEYGVDGMVKEKRNRCQLTNTLNLAFGVALCILFPVIVIIFDSFGERIANASEIGTAIGLAVLALGVFMIVRSSILNSGFSALLEEDDFSREKKSRSKKYGVFCAVYWLVVTSIFLAYSFITSDWGSSWIIFPVTAVLFPAVLLTIQSIDKKKNS